MRILGRTSTVIFSTVAAWLAACGSTIKGPPEPAEGGGSAAKAPAGTDLPIELEQVKLQGISFQPEALGRPPMTLVEGKKKETLDKQRAAYKAATGPAREVAAQVLATSLYQEQKKLKDDAKQKAMLVEARAALEDVRAAAKGSAEDVTLRMLGAMVLIDGDYAAGADVFGELVKRFPTGDHAAADKTWLALCQLRLGKNADALATVTGVTADPAQAELAYVTAWAKWRGGDGAGAVAAITAAAKGWKSEAARPAMTRDLLILLARGGAPAEAALQTVSDFVGGKPGVQLVSNLANSYAFAGRWSDAVAVLDKLLATMSDQVAKDDVPVFRGEEAQWTVRALDGAKVAAYAKQSVDAFAACGDKCKPEKIDDGYKNVRNLALFFHTLYATSMDERFYPPARALYDLYATLPARADAAEMKTNGDNLDAAKKAHKPGTHDQKILGAYVLQHAQEVQACYEAALAADPSTSGVLKLTLEVSDQGAVTGATSDPAPGKAGLAAVGGCAVAAAKTWAMPARTIPGTTRISASYELAPAPTK